MAIHGTADPRSVGRDASAGCVRVPERALQQRRREPAGEHLVAPPDQRVRDVPRRRGIAVARLGHHRPDRVVGEARHQPGAAGEPHVGRGGHDAGSARCGSGPGARQVAFEQIDIEQACPSAAGKADGAWEWRFPTVVAPRFLAGLIAMPLLASIFAVMFAPLAFLMGVPAADVGPMADLLGTKLVANEFVAFVELGNVRTALDAKSVIISTYALCGFANFSSIAIQIGGIGSLAPSRRGDIARLGIRAMIAGTLANFLTASIAGILL